MILPSKIDIGKAKANERKIEIDNGVSLAKQIDSLRETFSQERVAHENWKKSSVENLDYQIKELEEDIESKKRELIFLAEHRSKLIEPLDLEWVKVNKEKESLIKFKEELFLNEERYKKDLEDLEKEKIKVSQSVLEVKESEIKTEKNFKEVEEIKSNITKSYQEAYDFKENQESYYISRNNDLNKTIKEYEIALKTIEIREQAVKDKESELSEREILLKDRKAMIERNLKRNQNVTS